MRKLARKQVLIVAPIALLLVSAAAYKLVLAPKPASAAKKIDGVLYPLSSDFTVNLAQGRYAKVSIALVLTEPPAAGAEGASGGLPQEAAVRAVVTDQLTGLPADDLIVRSRRRALVARLEKALVQGTDEPITRVLLTDVAVQ